MKVDSYSISAAQFSKHHYFKSFLEAPKLQHLYFSSNLLGNNNNKKKASFSKGSKSKITDSHFFYFMSAKMETMDILKQGTQIPFTLL